MYEVNPVITLCFFWGYIVLVIMVLLNILISIVIDNYLMIRKMTNVTAITIWKQ